MRSPSRGRLLAPALLLLLLSCIADSTGPGGGPPAEVRVASGDAQSAVLGTALADPVAVRVTNARGKGVAGVEVSWAVSGGGGAVDPERSVTGADGTATARWTLGDSLGAQSLTATVAGLPGVTFSATATPVPVATVSVDPLEPSLPMWTTVQLTATPRDAGGNALPDRPVEWRSADTTVATVGGSGLVRGVKAGKVTVTATSEGKAGVATVTVTHATDSTPPTLAGFSISPSQIDVTSSGTTVEFTLAASDIGAGVSLISLTLRESPNRERSCNSGSPVEGSRSDGVWKCTISFPQGAAAGTWTVKQVILSDRTHTTWYEPQQLRDAGFPAELTVLNSGPPHEFPSLTGFTVTPEAVDVTSAAATVEFTFSVSASLDMKGVGVVIVPPASLPPRSCGNATLVSGTARLGTWKCSLTIEKASAAGDWTVSYVQLLDAGGASRTYLRSELAALGLPTKFSVTSTPGT